MTCEMCAVAEMYCGMYSKAEGFLAIIIQCFSILDNYT